MEAIIQDYGKKAFLSKISDPFWFQAFGAVMGMDWHSSGITTSVMGALKKAVNPKASELGIYICGGKGKNSRNTPQELITVGEKTGLDGNELGRLSRLTAKIDNTAIQDGFQVYLHSFIVTSEGDWSVVQQGMNDASGLARRYHWHGPEVQSFVSDPHTGIYGPNRGEILNLVDGNAKPTREGILSISHESPDKIISEARKLIMPSHHEVRSSDVNLKRLGAVLALAQESNVSDFESLLLTQGLGPRTLQSLTLVSEVIHGTPSRFNDPARFSFAHGGKDGHPFPVPTKVYDESIRILQSSLEKAKVDHSEKKDAIKRLSVISEMIEKDFQPNENFEEVIKKERRDSHKYGGRTVFGKSLPPDTDKNGQMKLF